MLLDVGTSNPRPSSSESAVHLGPLSRSREQRGIERVLAYVYGRYEVPAGTHPEESGYFLHIWRLAASGSPVLVLDLLSPLERK